MIIELKTERLLLRQWNAADFDAFATMNNDPEVMEFYPSLLSNSESNDLACRFQQLIADKGWGMWAVERLSDGVFIGFVGLHEPNFDLPVSPCVEIGWRLSRLSWGEGYATEAANRVLDFAFHDLSLDCVYSFTSVGNLRSRAVMERIGMVNTGNNFNHPMLPEGHALSEHVLYKTCNPTAVNSI